jgi:hypothetical protein
LITGLNTKKNTYAFGMAMPGRSYQSSSGYRYGMNGQEKDNEIFEGAFTAEFWEYDSRIGRRWNVDPVVKPWESSYACFSNNPIWFSDVNGDDAVISDLLHRSGDEAEMSKELGGNNDPGFGMELCGSDGWVPKDGGGFKYDADPTKGTETATWTGGDINNIPYEVQGNKDGTLDVTFSEVTVRPVITDEERFAYSRNTSRIMDDFCKGMVVGAFSIFSAPVIAEAGIFGGPLADVFNQKVIQGKSQDEFNYASTATSLIFSGGNMFTSTVLGASGNLINGTKKDFKAGTILQIKNENFVSFGAGILGNTFSGAHMKGIGYAGFAQSKNAKTIFDFGTSALGGAVSNSIESEFPSKK